MADSQDRNSTSLVPAAIKKHTPPILYGLASNALFQIGILGVPAAIAWIAAHAAIASGVPLWLSILIGSVILLLLAITANYIKTLFQKERHGVEPGHFNGVLEISNKPKPNLVSFDARIVLIGQDSDDTLYQCESTQEIVIGGAAVAFIKNEVDDQPIGEANSVRAHISFSEITGPRTTEINNALWLGSRHRRKNFEVGDTERLIIAVKPVPEGDIYAVESNYVTRAGERVYSPLYPKLLGKIYIVTVKLVGGEHGEINQTLQYRLETKPDFYIEQMDETQAPKSTAEVERLRSEILLLGQTVSEAQAEAQNWRDQYDEEHNAALRLKTVSDQYEIQINKLKSDAEEARREKITADSNLQGVENDRNNYRTWFNELSWLKPTIKRQQNDISSHVEVVAARPCLLNIKERVVIVDLVIRNSSFFDITIKPDAVAGQLSTNKKGLLHDPAKALIDIIHPAVENLEPTKEATFAVIQPLFKDGGGRNRRRHCRR